VSIITSGFVFKDVMGSIRLSLSRFSKSHITAAAALFVLLVCLIVVAITSWNALNAHRVELREAEIATVNMARSIAQHADDVFKASDITLVGIKERLVKDGTSPEALQRLHGFAELLVEEMPALSAIYVFDKNGDWLVSSRSITIDPGANANREYFIFHKNHVDLGPHIGLPQHSRFTHRWVIPISRRLNGPDGEFFGVAVASIELDYFNRFYASFDIGHDGVILLFMNHGIQLTRWPLLQDSIGKDMASGPVISRYASRYESGNATIIAPSDGVERMVGYDHLQHFPAIAIAALSKEELLASWYNDVLVQGAVILVVVSMLAFLGFRLIGQISLRMHAEEEARHAGEALLTLNRTLEKLALQDGLTGLANRRQFDTVFQNELSRARRSASSLALIMIDVDCFKTYNDIYGHLAGDECLRRIAKVILAAEVRSGDLAARYGGEEFSVLLPSTDVQGAFKVAEEIRTTVRELEIKHDGNAGGIVTISAGVNALAPTDGADTPSTLIAAADQALYEAKLGGRNQTCIYRDTSAGAIRLVK
jgi:diguanylate cyclase (GGDEF)-like protein